MNNVLHSPLEALAVNYLSFGFLPIVNSLWAWIAVVTAAVSIWRLKAVGTTATSAVIYKCASPSPAALSHSICRSTATISETLPPDSTAANLLASAVPSVRPAQTASSTQTSQQTVDDGGEHDGGLKNSKFRFYYFEEDVEVEDELRADSEWDDVVVCGIGEWWEWWEKALKMKNGEIGWYRQQDMTKLNGNIVKLWDDRRGGER